MDIIYAQTRNGLFLEKKRPNYQLTHKFHRLLSLEVVRGCQYGTLVIAKYWFRGLILAQFALFKLWNKSPHHSGLSNRRFIPLDFIRL